MKNGLKTFKTIIEQKEIANLLQEGKIFQFSEKNNYYFAIKNTVIKGYQESRKIGFPTINFLIDFQDLSYLKLGCYLTLNHFHGKNYYGLTCVIEKGDKILVATYLKDFHQMIYFKKVTTIFLKFFRENIPFQSWKQMKKLITLDLKEFQSIPKVNEEKLKRTLNMLKLESNL